MNNSEVKKTKSLSFEEATNLLNLWIARYKIRKVLQTMSVAPVKDADDIRNVSLALEALEAEIVKLAAASDLSDVIDIEKMELRELSVEPNHGLTYDWDSQSQSFH